MSENQREKGSAINPEEVTVPELQDELRDLDQPVSGNKDELIERLETARGDAVANQPDPIAGLADTTEEDLGEYEVRADGSRAYFTDKDRREQASAQTMPREHGTNTGRN